MQIKNSGFTLLMTVLGMLAAFRRIRTENLPETAFSAAFFLFLYAVLEIFVFILEAAAYSIGMKKLSERPPKTAVCIVYALVANALSFAAGLALSFLLPGIF